MTREQIIELIESYLLKLKEDLAQQLQRIEEDLNKKANFEDMVKVEHVFVSINMKEHALKIRGYSFGSCKVISKQIRNKESLDLSGIENKLNFGYA